VNRQAPNTDALQATATPTTEDRYGVSEFANYTGPESRAEPAAPVAPPAPSQQKPPTIDELERQMPAVDGPSTWGTRVRLRPVQPEDYRFLYWIQHQPNARDMAGRTPVAVAPERFPDRLWAGVVSQFVIVSTEDETIVGIVSLAGVDYANGHARLDVKLRPDSLDESWALEGVELYVDHVFNSFALRKLYLEMSDDMLDRLGRVFEQELMVEGRLAGHSYVAGNYVDTVIGAFYRDEWQKRTRTIW